VLADAPVTQTRGIVRVPVEGTTAFALERALPAEINSGNYASRELVSKLIHK
jgi:hypothetical protein